VNADLLTRAPIALLPVLLFLAGLVQLDGYKLVRMRMMIALVATGALAAGVAYVVNNIAFAHFHLLLPGLFAAVALHTGYNYLLVRPALATLATLLVLPFVIYLVFDHSERILRKWIEVDLDSDVNRLEAISTGRFLDSASGRYLQALRDRFKGEQLADMLCYLRVHGELAVRAKGVLLLREAGMPDLPIDAETGAKLAELGQLERAIGKTGMLALRPLMMATGKEIWQLTLLRQ